MGVKESEALLFYRQAGYRGDDVERMFKFGKVCFKKDFCGFVDTIVFGRGGVIMIQQTADRTLKDLNHDKRIRKIRANPETDFFLDLGVRIHVVSWSPARRITSIGKNEIVEIDLPDDDLQAWKHKSSRQETRPGN